MANGKKWEEKKEFGWVGKSKFSQVRITDEDGKVNEGYLIQPHYQDKDTGDLKPKKGGVWFADAYKIRDAIRLLNQMAGEADVPEKENRKEAGEGKTEEW